MVYLGQTAKGVNRLTAAEEFGRERDMGPREADQPTTTAAPNVLITGNGGGWLVIRIGFQSPSYIATDQG
jgi:hypothetical protein